MKLTGADAMRYLARPDPGRAGLLIFGADGMRVADKRIAAVAALIGPEGEAEMRFTRIAAAELRKEPGRVGDALAEIGFFPGPRVVLVEDATDTVTEALTRALAGWRKGDGVLVVTAGGLTGKSTLKAVFETAPNAVAVGLYDDPPSREEIEAMLQHAGLTRIDPAAMGELTLLSRDLEPGDFRQTVDKLGLYKLGDAAPLTPAEIHALAPSSGETDVLDLASAAAEGRADRIGPLIRRIEAQGTQAVGIVIQVTRYFQALHAAAADPGGASAGIRKTFGFGNRRDAMQAQAQRLGLRALEQALSALVETDLTLRSTSRAPTMAVMERALIRIAMLKRDTR
jgi:DNA polymerase-3 subunit delta